MTSRDQPRPKATEYWRYGDILVRVSMVRDGDPDDEPPQDGWVTFRRANAKPREGESEIPVWEFRRDAELVFSDYQKDEVLERLKERERDLRDLVGIAHAISVVGADLKGEALWAVQDAADTLEASASATLRALAAVKRPILGDRSKKRMDSLRALNDELGVPNCDHLVMDPDCKECEKLRIEP